MNDLYNDKLLTIDYSSELLSWKIPAVGISMYGVVIFAIWSVMRSRTEFQLRWVNIIHNAFLCILSFIMAAGTIFDIGYDTYKNGFMHAFCDANQEVVHSRVFFWALVFYLSKYYEFLDTVILALRKKPLTFLHVYHHLATAGVVYLLVVGKVNITWILVFLNSTVHTFMYYYYTISLFGYSVWWKKFLTSGQIVQFFILLGGASVQLYWRYVVGSPLCSGDMLYFGLGFGFTFSLVVLFVQFYRSTYKRQPVKAKAH